MTVKWLDISELADSAVSEICSSQARDGGFVLGGGEGRVIGTGEKHIPPLRFPFPSGTRSSRRVDRSYVGWDKTVGWHKTVGWDETSHNR